ncbi:hypothetical protein K461DRAFT_24470 [Myriangium duriaei CBS 260.36]|uniref:NAD-dependent epimerase/dehydratase domain-containing protein n=1 Tax=Myriangium duriaei CBS 260.36 TaxID=1168546 RepID=A0A9P4MLW9_9PEZI|nr:hypothetical protein K461DRAFT_24470 [Myriangium duriaei CBS 260.36]
MAIDTFLSGGTGLVGSRILTTLANQSSLRHIYAFGRRDLKPDSSSPSTNGPKFTPLVDADTSRWTNLLTPRLTSSNDASVVFFSALGTTRAKAGGLDKQRKIDHDLPLSLAESFASQRKPDSPRRVFVLISSSGANPNSFMGYPKLKGETEEAVKALLRPDGGAQETGLDHVVILRPGLIVGTRRQEDSRPTEYVIRKIAEFAGMLGNGFKDFWAQDADVIAKAAVNAGIQCAEGRVKDRVWLLGQSDIVRLGRTEWGKDR